MNWVSLKKAPIREAIVEFQFITNNETKLGIEKFIKNCKSEYPIVKEKFGFHFTAKLQVETPNLTTNKNNEGYILNSENKKQVIQISNNRFSFHIIKPYNCWSDFLKIAKSLWLTLSECIKIDTVEKISLRYINEINISLDEKGELEYDIKMLPNIPENLNVSLNHYFMQIGIKDEQSSIHAIINQSFSAPKDNLLPFIFDIDAFKLQDYTDWDLMWADMSKIRDFKNKIFFNSLSKEIIKKYE